MSARRVSWHLLATTVGIGVFALSSSPVLAAPSAADDGQRQLVETVELLKKELGRQGEEMARQRAEIDALRRDLGLANALAMRARGLAQGPTSGQTPVAAPEPDLPDVPVGEGPAVQEIRVETEAVPEGQGVLTPKGTLVFDPSIEYTRSSHNRLVFRGIELVPGIQIGLIEATDSDRDTFVGTFALRYGLTDRLEIEGRLPYMYRRDRIEVVQQRDEGIVREIRLRGHEIGDAEFAIRYQINRPVGQKPIYVASLRVKSDTGRGPFDVGYDEFGVAEELSTGSGFWAISPGISFLLPSDPVVIYGGMSYLWHIKRDVDKVVGDAFVGRVDPGDAISANIGFGFALNPRFSYSLGYRHEYIFHTKTEIGDANLKSKSLQAGSLILGASYRITGRRVLNLGFQFGVTEDAPDMSVTLRLPFAFEVF